MSWRKGLVAPNDPILTQIAKPVALASFHSFEIQQDLERMMDVAYNHRKDRSKPTVVGLAAPQVGISKQIILVDIGADGKGKLSNLQLYFNPEIIWHSQEENEWYEGCWSTSQVCGIVSRPSKIKVKAFDANGKRIEQLFAGYVARMFQHEIDHLNGKEFITHITDGNNLHWVEDDQFPEYRNAEAWRNWPIKCPREKWEAIKIYATLGKA